ncbi:hypothetical protein [Streptomyces sp. NPDC086519]|uniref:hypothetical protein n=1 Tax=Streptomyces sp. NPDC086519 TaxID=3154863 RepID=UPI00344905DC
MDEFVLRLVDHKVGQGHRIAGLLGLPERMVDQTVAGLFSSDDLRWSRPAPGTTTEPSLALTGKGRVTAREAAQNVPVVKSILQSKSHRVLPVKLLVYADTDRTDIQLGVVVGGELSHPHDLALIGLGGAKALGITVEAPAERPVLEPELEKAARDRIAHSRLTGRWHRGCRRPGNRGSAGRRAQQHRPRPRDRPAQHGQRRGLGGYQHPSPARRRRRRRRAADHPTGSGHPGG